MTDAHEDEKWDAYHGTVLVVRHPEHEVRADLRRPLPPAFAEAMRVLGLAPPVAILTAENPYGENADDAPDPRREAREAERNLHRTETLLEELRAAGLPHARVDGMAPDGSYRERCVAVPLDAAAARELARRLRQLAFFRWDGAMMWLEPGLAEREAERLPRDGVSRRA